MVTTPTNPRISADGKNFSYYNDYNNVVIMIGVMVLTFVAESGAAYAYICNYKRNHKN